MPSILTALAVAAALGGCITASRPPATHDTSESADSNADDAIAADTAAQDTSGDDDAAADTRITDDTEVAVDADPPTDTMGLEDVVQADGVVSADADAGPDDGGPLDTGPTGTTCPGTPCAPGVLLDGSCVQTPVGRHVALTGDWAFAATAMDGGPGTTVGVANVGSFGDWAAPQSSQVASVFAPDFPLAGEWCTAATGAVTFGVGTDVTLSGQIDDGDELIAGVDPSRALFLVAVKRATSAPTLGSRYRLIGLTPAIGGALAGVSGWIGFDASGCVNQMYYATSEPDAVIGLGIGQNNCVAVSGDGGLTLDGLETSDAGTFAGTWRGQLAPSGAVAMLHRKLAIVGSTIFPGVLLLVRENSVPSSTKLEGEFGLAGLDATANADALRGDLVLDAEGGALVSGLYVARTQHADIDAGGALETDWYQVGQGANFEGDGMYRHNVAGGEVLETMAGQVGPVPGTSNRFSWLAAVAIAGGGQVNAPPSQATLLLAIRKR